MPLVASTTVVTLTLPTARKLAEASLPTLTIPRLCITEGSRPVLKYNTVGDDELMEDWAERVTGSSSSRETLYEPDREVVRPEIVIAVPAPALP